MKIINAFLIGAFLSNQVILATEPSVNGSEAQESEVLNQKEAKDLKTKTKTSQKKKLKMKLENPSSKNTEQDDAPPAPPVY